jgi:predicted alpha/beta-hydrolase family hydrolase
MKIKISEKIGSVSAEVIIPKKAVAVLVLAHGAGAGMNHPFMEQLSNELSKFQIGTVRFNFPFTENKKGRPDVPAVAHATIEAVVLSASKKYPKLPLFISGKSFGGRMSSQLLSTKEIELVSGIIFFGFPLHQPGNPGIERADHLRKVKVPMLFLQGTRDALADFTMIQKVTKGLKKAKLVSFEGADHSFKASKQNLIPVLAESAATWIYKITETTNQ